MNFLPKEDRLTDWPVMIILVSYYIKKLVATSEKNII